MSAREECLRECLKYFRERPVYEKLFSKFREKSVSLGHFGGKVTLSSLSRGVYISNKLTSSHGQSDHLSRIFRSLISERYSR